MRNTELRRNVAAAMLAVALLSVTAGCSSDSSADAESVELEFWTFIDPNNPDDPRSVALKEIVDEYNEGDHLADVTIRSINYAKIDAEVIKATANGQGPDIVNVYSDQLPMHVAAGTLQPMTQFAEPVLDELADDFIFPLGGVTFDDEIMAMPWETRVWLLQYRADLLSEAGLEVPKSLDELGSVGAALQAPGMTGLGIGFSNAGLGSNFIEKFIPLVWGEDGEVFEAGEAVFDDAAGDAAMETFIQWYEQGAFGDEVLAMGGDEIVNGLKAGTIAMTINGSHRVGAARSGDGIGDNLQTAPIPSDDPEHPLQTPVAGQTLAIGADASSPEAVWDFIGYYTSPESQARFAGAGVLPVQSSVYDSPDVQQLPNAAELATWAAYAQNYGRPNPTSDRFTTLSDLLVTGAQQIVFQGADTRETLARVASDFNSR